MGIGKIGIIEQGSLVGQEICSLATEMGWSVGPMEGIDLLFYIAKESVIEEFMKNRRAHPDALIVPILGKSCVEEVVELLRRGAFDALSLPLQPEKVKQTLSRAKKPLSLLHGELIAESRSMKLILDDLERIAKSRASVLITGESGTGKEVIAHAIHHNSGRAGAPFIKINCAALPESLLESELFGHEKGAFTGAISRRIGRFEQAHGGSLLLDEITEMPLAMQAKLLRAIQEKQIERVGGNQTIPVDVRFIATSNRDLSEAIDQKLFREDLFYRLNVASLHLPPLRERQEDILPLAHYFLKKQGEVQQKENLFFDRESEAGLLSYSWPGNVRELSNLIERSVVMSRSSKIEIAPEKRGYKHRALLEAGLSLEELEKRLILETLKTQNENRTKTAELLGISLRTLRNKLALYNVS